MRRLEGLIFGLLVIVSIGLLVWTIQNASSKSTLPFTNENYARAKAAENPNDKCATPPGYTDAQWREHMSHHPDQYAGCL